MSFCCFANGNEKTRQREENDTVDKIVKAHELTQNNVLKLLMIDVKYCTR